MLVERLSVEASASIRRGILLALGEYGADGLPASLQNRVTVLLLSTYRADPDPGVHSAVDWVLRRWGRASDLATIDAEAATPDARPDRNWYTSRQGVTFAVVRGPVVYDMGSGTERAGCGSADRLRWPPGRSHRVNSRGSMAREPPRLPPVETARPSRSHSMRRRATAAG